MVPAASRRLADHSRPDGRRNHTFVKRHALSHPYEGEAIDFRTLATDGNVVVAGRVPSEAEPATIMNPALR